jgi:hypothetical protein
MGWKLIFFLYVLFKCFGNFVLLNLKNYIYFHIYTCVFKHIISYTHLYLFYMTCSNFTNLCPYCNAIGKSLRWWPYFGAITMRSIYNRKVWSHLSQQSRKGNIFKLIYGLCSYDTRKIWSMWWNFQMWRNC